MANKMLIDATHPEETRVVVLRGNRVEEFDFEAAHRKQLRGNIYLAKVTRVEPSLQAAFVDYGGNRHGFLAFSEIHPDYYQIPVADRQALIDEEERAQRAADAEADRRAQNRTHHRSRAAQRSDEQVQSERFADDEATAGIDDTAETPAGDAAVDGAPDAASSAAVDAMETSTDVPALARPAWSDTDAAEIETAAAPASETPESVASAPGDNDPAATEIATTEIEFSPAQIAAEPLLAEPGAHAPGEPDEDLDHDEDDDEGEREEEIIESVGGSDALEEVPERSFRPRRQYKIQEVIKRRQVMLVQVVKEERGTKGAALTTYLSLAGRYSVLMPNTARGGGISRKITDSTDRKRLKEIAQELDVPEGMGIILRTAGAARTKTEVKRDFEYLLRMWEQVRDLTLNSMAPMLVYEEGSLVKRSIRDLYNKDIDEIIVAGDQGYQEAKDFMRMLMPSHAKNVRPYRETQPLFSRYGIEAQLDAMFQPTVQLKSGGYIVLNQTEALVSIDVNSGRATREHHIEDTALKTNLEAADEIARQLRLRDLAGLIVIDFIDMDEKRNNRSVERRMKDCLKHDRARIQVGHISHFGLLEMSRQRIRSSVLESSTEKCPHCGGTGHVRSVSSVALQLLRAIEETLNKGGTHNLNVRTRAEVALYVLNQKRAHLRELEERFQITISVTADATVSAHPSFVVDRGEQVHTPEAARALLARNAAIAPAIEEEPIEELLDEEPIEDSDEEADDAEAATGEAETAAEGDGERNGRRRRRRRRGRRDGREPRETAEGVEPGDAVAAAEPAESVDAAEESEERDDDPSAAAGDVDENGERRRRRRGRRGGRRNRRGRDGEATTEEFGSAVAPDSPVDPDVGTAVADFDSAPPREIYDDAPEPEAVNSPAQEPEPVPSLPSAPEPVAVEESPRRRSTVREPAPTSAEAARAPLAAPEPGPMPESEPEAPAAESEADGEAKPRRTGWWSRKLIGG